MVETRKVELAGGVYTEERWRGEENAVEWRQRHEGYLWMARLKLTEVGARCITATAGLDGKKSTGRGWVGG